MSELDANDLRGLAKHLNASAVELIEQVLQKHTAAILDVVREQTRELEAEREKVRVLREAAERMYKAYMEGGSCAIIAAVHDLEEALQATAQEKE